MTNQHPFLSFLGIVVVVSPLLLTLVLGVASLLDRKPSEEATARMVYAAIVAGLLAAVGVLVGMLVLRIPGRHLGISLGDWVVIPGHFHFSVKFIFDRLSVPFAILSFVLSGTIGAFATKYMHRERGYNRFFVLYSIFLTGMVVTSLAGTIETLFAGWELVGLSSALLVAFFQERPAPSRNGLWVWTVYRVSDAGLLLAAVVMHHLLGEGDLDTLLGYGGGWPFETSTVAPRQALVVGLLLLAAAAGKSALVPFSGWLPRAMEGPTPSSAVFYGALSVHLGAFLLLRVSPLLERSALLCALIVALGLTTAVFAYLAGSVQTDIKSALSFVSLSQVGIIVAEIGLGFRYVALVHIVGHACLRTLQFVRAPTLLQDYRTLENAIGARLPSASAPLGRIAPGRLQTWLYRLALERGYLDTMLSEFVVAPFVRAFRWCDAMERRWTDFLSGGASRESDQVKPHFGTIEELMNPLHLPWLELAVAVALVGSPVVSRFRDPNLAYRWGLAFTGASFACAFLAWLAFYLGVPAELTQAYSAQPFLFGRQKLALDELSAPLVPVIALLHFLTAVATARTNMRRFSFSWSLAAEAIRLATFSTREAWPLIALLAASTVPPYVELINRGRPTRLYVVHMALFVGLLVLGYGAVEFAGGPSSPPPWWATLPLMAAVLVRCGTVPAHCWVTDWFEHASFGIALLYVAPLSGVYAAVRLVLPIAPDWVLRYIGLVSLFTAVYAAGMATIQRESRRFFAHLFLSHASLVLVGLELHTDLSLTASLCLWFSVLISLGGFGLTLRALESRFGRLSLADYHGLYEHTPALAVFFLLTGLASVGFPGTLGFISTELLVDSAVEANLSVGVGVVVASALNGIAVLRAYFLLFTGARHVSTVSLKIGPRERVAVLTLSALILGGGFFPQPGVTNREHAAEEILQDRRRRRIEKTAPPEGTTAGSEGRSWLR